MKTLVISAVILFSSLSFGQSLKDVDMMNDRVIVNHPESTIYASVVPGKSNRSVNENYLYYWFASNDIKKTRGGFDGKLLHGIYIEFYLNKNLKEKGKLRHGLKEGYWKSWFPNGEFKEIILYKRSSMKSFKEFYDDGSILGKGKFKNDKLNGIVRVYEKDGSMKKIKYKEGVIVGPKSKIEKDTLKNEKKNRLKNKKTISDTISPTAPIEGLEKGIRKNREKEVKQNNVSPDGNPENIQKEGNKRKNRKEEKKQEDVKVRKFLWIIPLAPEQPKEKQT